MRLSEAIRLGAMLKPQHFGHYRNEDDSATCAVGAAMDASSDDAFMQWQEIERVIDAHCPVCLKRLGLVNGHRQIVPHLNDDHYWTREQIADWIQTIEPPETPPAIERTPDAEYAWVQTSNTPRAD